METKHMRDNRIHQRFVKQVNRISPSVQSWETAPTHPVKRDSSTSYEPSLRESLIPLPLNHRSDVCTIPEATDPLQSQLPTAPTPVHSDAAAKVKEHFGVDEVTVNFSRLRPFPATLSPRPAPRSWRSSWNRLSLTPSEMPYPINLRRIYEEAEDDFGELETALGFRRVAIAPPVPPKDPRRAESSSFTSSTSSLALHKEVVIPADSIEDPLNGRTAWLHAFTGMLVVFNCWGLSNSFGLFEAYYSTIMLPHTSPSAIAWIGSTQLALVFGLGVPVGKLVDKGYLRVMFHGGSVIMLLGIFLTSLCTKLWSLWLVSGLITGLGMGMAFCSGVVALMTWFDEKKMGSAMGLASAGSCLGGIVYVLLARHFLVHKGFKTTMLVLGAVATVTMIPANLVFRVRGQKHRSCRSGKRGNRASATKSTLSWRIFVEPAYVLATGGLFLSFLGVYFGFVYMPLYAHTVLHLSDTASTDLLVFMLAANLFGRLLPGLISDRCIGPLNTIIPSVFLSSAVIWLWTASGENKASLTVIACFYGFVSGGIQALYAPTVHTFCLEPIPKSLTVTKQDTQLAMDRMGIKTGGIFTCIGVACLIGSPIGGSLISHRTNQELGHPYLSAQIFAGVSLLVGGALLLASRVKKKGWAAQRA